MANLVDPCPKGGNHAWQLTRKGTSYICVKCKQTKAASTAPTADFWKKVEEPKPQPTKDENKDARKKATPTGLIEIIISFVAPAFYILAMALFFGFNLLLQGGIVVWTVFAIAYLVLLWIFLKNGFVSGVISLVIFVAISYFFVIPIVTGDTGPIDRTLAYFGIPPDVINSITGPIKNIPLYMSCAFSGSLQACATAYGGGGGTPKISKSLDNYKFINVEFVYDETGNNFVNPVTNGKIFSPQIKISANGQHTTTDIVVDGDLTNETGGTIKMNAENCKTADEHCEVGPGRPLIVTFKSSKPVDFVTNTLVFLNARVSYPYASSGSNDFYVVQSQQDVNGLPDTTQTKALSPGLGPLDIRVSFSKSYYIVGSSQIDPDLANIEVYSDIMNGKQINYGENGYGKIAQIKISHLSDITGVNGICSSPEGDQFNEDQVFDIGGTKVTNIQRFNCTYTIPDTNLEKSFDSIKFVTDLSYNYTEVEKSVPMTVLSSS